MSKYAGVVVLYNPDIDIYNNINSYIDDLDIIYIIDNSEITDESIVGKIKGINKCVYINLMGNKGLAYALNVGCEMAREGGNKYVLTMDQDSIFAEGSVKKIIEFIENTNEHYAIVCPNVKSVYYDDNSSQKKIAYTLLSEDRNELKKWVMTSGSMMCLEDYDSVNGFDNQMFIAHIDIDLCIKFNLKNKKIIMLGNSIIYQRFGNSVPKRILWKKVHPSFASLVRTYYLFRNQKYLEIKYGNKTKKFINVHLYKFIIKIVLFEKQKFKKIKMALIGFNDGKNGKMGMYTEK